MMILKLRRGPRNTRIAPSPAIHPQFFELYVPLSISIPSITAERTADVLLLD